MDTGQAFEPGASSIGDPLLSPVPPPNRFNVDVDYVPYFYTAAYTRPLIRKISLHNESWNPTTDEIQVYVFVKSASGANLTLPFAKAYKSPEIRDRILVETLQIQPNLEAVVQLNEAESAALVIQVRDQDDLLSEHRFPIDFLAYNQWMHLPYDYYCLSAFVMPNHPVVSEIMQRVRERLKTSTGDGTTSGYQSFFPLSDHSIIRGRERNLEVLRAIFEELQSREFEYSNPPASFEGHGQKIRTPDLVVEQNAATCLDSTVLAASCIAAAGLIPLLFLVRGHAFPGAWLTPVNSLSEDGQPQVDPTRQSVISNRNILQALANDFVVSFESTQLCRSLAVDFDEALNPHLRFSHGDLKDDFEAVIDVQRAFETGIRGLPLRKFEGGNVIVQVAPADPLSQFGAFYEPFESSDTSATAGKLNDGDVPPRVRRWMDVLLDISNSNALINLKANPVLFPREKQFSPRSALELPVPVGLLGTIEDRISSHKPLELVPVHRLPMGLAPNPSVQQLKDEVMAHGRVSVGNIEAFFQNVDHLSQTFVREQNFAPQDANGRAYAVLSEAHEKEAARRLRGLKSVASEVEASSGSNQLYLTFGTLSWKAPAEQGKSEVQVRSPLFFIPVRLKGSPTTSVSVTAEENAVISPNYCLLEKLRVEKGVIFDELSTPDLDESGIDLDKTIKSLLGKLGKAAYESMSIEETCSLAVLDFANFRIWNDIKQNWRLFTKNAVVDHLVKGGVEDFSQDVESFTDEFVTPFDCDESQLDAIKWSLEGRSFVLEGPPGTGKSQTIANMISANVTQGRRVLFVAEKVVALEAVSKKLNNVGLRPFCITMHHETTTADSVRKQLEQSLAYSSRDLKTQVTSDSAKLQSYRKRLDNYRDALLRGNGIQDSVLRAAREVERLGDGECIEVPRETLGLLVSQWNEVRSALLELPQVAGGSILDFDRAWSLVNQSDIGNVDKSALSQSLGRLDTLMGSIEEIGAVVDQLLNSHVVSDASAVEEIISLIASGSAPDLETARLAIDPKWKMSIAKILRQIDSLKSDFSSAIDFFNPSAFFVDVSIQVSAAQDAVNAGFFKKRRTLERLTSLVQPLAKSEIGNQPAQLLNLLQQIQPIRDRLLSIRRELDAIPGLDLQADFDPLDSSHLENLSTQVDQVEARTSLILSPAGESIRRLLESGHRFDTDDLQRVQSFLREWKTINDAFSPTEASFAVWRADQGAFQALRESLPVWRIDATLFQTLSRWIRLNQIAKPLREAGQSELVAGIFSGSVNLSSLFESFERGMARALLFDFLESDDLQTFDLPTFERAIADFIRADRSFKNLLSEAIPSQLADSRPFKPGQVPAAIGALKKELTKKVRQASLPKLIREHGEAVTRLTPCFLMSPEAVSRLLPADSQFFDVVIFDEASQVRVASAIPSMGRGRSVIVVGDSQQMPPSKKIGTKSSANDDEDDTVLQDLESILVECREANLPSRMLTCHFRSEHEALIAFSNRNFYGGNLMTFPAPNSSRTSPVRWFEITDGQFHRTGDQRQTNPAEARAIVEEIVRRLADPEHSSKSIGVVTFNEPQTDLILQELGELSRTNTRLQQVMGDSVADEDRLFVVPLERVQGDERDTIILSVSYSYQNGDRTKVPTNWGPLTNAGGERRLNVAITRAKKDLLVFCSFNPDHVDVKNSLHKGVPATVEFLKEVRDSSSTGTSHLGARAISERDELRQRIFEQLTGAGFSVKQNVGLSNFRVDLSVADEHGSEFLAILIDSPKWAEKSTAFDREALPNSVLHRIGWHRLGRLFTKPIVMDSQLPVRIVTNEVRREAFRHSLMTSLSGLGFEIRLDSQVSERGIDFAVREKGQTKWPLAIRLAVPDTFPQFVSYEGEVPPTGVLADVEILASKIVRPHEHDWAVDEDLLNEIQASLQDSSKEIERQEVPDLSGLSQAQSGISTLPLSSDGDSDSTDELVLDVNDLQSSSLSVGFSSGASLPQIGSKELLGPGPEVREDLIRKAIFEIVETEGPIVESRLATLTVRRFGMNSVYDSRLKALRVYFSAHPKTVGPEGSVYWPTHRSPKSWRGFRLTSSEERAMTEIPHEEVSNAFIALVNQHGVISTDQAIRQVALAFGLQRLRTPTREHISAILAWAIGEQLIELKNDELHSSIRL